MAQANETKTAEKKPSQRNANKNMEIYNHLKAVPDGAKKPIEGGRLSGMTSINPMWRVQAMTEMFGPYGIGWRMEEPQNERMDENGVLRPTNPRIQTYDNGEKVIYKEIHLYIKYDGTWSAPIVGHGSAREVAKERNGLFVDIEAEKKATTDAFGNAAKMLGVGADVYFNSGFSDDNKYDSTLTPEPATPVLKYEFFGPEKEDDEIIEPEQVMFLEDAIQTEKKSAQRILQFLNSSAERNGNELKKLDDMTYKEYTVIIGFLNGLKVKSE